MGYDCVVNLSVIECGESAYSAAAAAQGRYPLLAHYCLKKFSVLMKKEVLDISAEVMSLLKVYEFPGNVHELENIIQRGVAICGGSSIETVHLPDDLR